MPKDKSKKRDENRAKEPSQLHSETKKSVWVVAFLGIAVLLILAGVGQAGPWGSGFYAALNKLFGWGYYFLPTVCFLLTFSFFSLERHKLWGITAIGAVMFVLSGLGFLDIVSPGSAGLTGSIVGSLKGPFGTPASIVITITVLLASFLITVNKPLKLSRIAVKKDEDEIGDLKIQLPKEAPTAEPVKEEIKKSELKKEKVDEEVKFGAFQRTGNVAQRSIKNYVPPPLSLLASTVEKPTIGDLRANANIIKRTLEGFGISVEMGEINVGPTVTRYTLKPAEGMKLSRITALHSDLALALAAHPIRIEAPIPGKSLVGIEVPNKTAALVRLGSMLLYPEFQKAEPLVFALGRNVSGEPIFPDIEKMPHLLIAGATGSGKSISIHTLVLSLLYKNSPEMLKLIMIDPKRVELSVYDGLPHLIAPVVTDNKHAIGALRWVIQEMDRRYQTLLEAGARDIRSYNKSQKGELLPFITIVIDELADLMATYGREVEGSIIRLAQMARATGIHLIVSTQRPSVEVITGLIKANITSRIALQVASQVDSRTILDTAGADKLLGNGDLLYVSAELSKPRRIQGSYITEDEIKSVVQFIKKNNEPGEEMATLDAPVDKAITNGELFSELATSGDDDELYGEAVEVVRVAKKASASLLQRRLKVGYARAARLLDIMEERGIIGPGEGAKPRDVLISEE